jgi:hypothetical protein
MTWPTAAEPDSPVKRFLARTLPKPEWTHAAHLAVGTWHVRTHGAARALAELRTGIRALNDSRGTPNTDSSGYHQTITRACVVVIDGFLGMRDGEDVASSVRALLASPAADRKFLLTFYSEEKVKSDDRTTWCGC